MADDDVEVLSWILITAFKSEATEENTKQLIDVFERMPPNTPYRYQAALLLYNLGVVTLTDEIIALLSNSEAPIDIRASAARLLGELEEKKALGPLAEQINNYQISLDVVTALGNIRDKSSSKLLVKRLKRERFPERRATVTQALGKLKNKRVLGDIAGELSREEPTPVALLVMKELGCKTKVFKDDATSSVIEHTLFNGKDSATTKAKSIRRVVVLTDASADGGSIQVMYGDTQIGTIPVFSGVQQGYFDVNNADLKGDVPATIQFKTAPADLTVELISAAVISAL